MMTGGISLLGTSASSTPPFKILMMYNYPFAPSTMITISLMKRLSGAESLIVTLTLIETTGHDRVQW